jgi:hypothetical protein
MEGARVEFDESFDERKGKPRAERVTGGTQGEDRGPPAPRDNTCRDFARGNCNRDNCRFSHDGGGGGGGGFGGIARVDRVESTTTGAELAAFVDRIDLEDRAARRDTSARVARARDRRRASSRSRARPPSRRAARCGRRTTRRTTRDAGGKNDR